MLPSKHHLGTEGRAWETERNSVSAPPHSSPEADHKNVSLKYYISTAKKDLNQG